MAYPVYMEKEFEDEESVIYWFCINTNFENAGRIQLNKKTKIIKQLVELSNVEKSLSDWAFNRAGIKISQCYRENNFPKKLEIIH
ncbi:hypothetical protein [Gottfriedia acidiceleris]|uniref:hypothetical protein n=1 Tax=Gottfriedia acidiceleris TaxID=371036 RepID=UPI002FFE4452